MFILQCSLHFQDCANAFSSSRAKVTSALSYLTGPALSWFKPGLFAPSWPTWVNHWDLFHTKLESNFGPFDPVGVAKAEIETLVMAEGSHSMTYFVEFDHCHGLSPDPPYPSEASLPPPMVGSISDAFRSTSNPTGLLAYFSLFLTDSRMFLLAFFT